MQVYELSYGPKYVSVSRIFVMWKASLYTDEFACGHSVAKYLGKFHCGELHGLALDRN